MKVQEEMDEIFGNFKNICECIPWRKDILGTSERSCTSDDLKQMKYTEKCIKESLRLRPAVPNISRKVENDIEIGESSQH